MPECNWIREKKILDEGVRRSMPGSFVRLTRGYTHYEEGGPRGERPVVLIHGFSVPYVIWDRTVQALQGAGLHTIRYDQYGRGFSDRPDTAYDMTLFVEQLLELIDALGCQEVDLVGLSMGGPIAAALSVSHPERVRRIVLIDPSGVGPGALGALRGISFLPGISAAFICVTRSAYLLDRIAGSFYDPTPVRAFRHQYRVQMEYRGFAGAAASAMRHGMLGTFASTYARLAVLQKEILLIWGEEDATIPFARSRELLQLLPQAEFFPVPRSGHVPHLERPDVVHPRLLEFLN
jgi:pimeloyl-ACP methyl ester carboxylesterase